MKRLAPFGNPFLAKFSERFAAPMSPEDWASCLVVGIVLGVFPVPACPTMLCAAAAFTLRLNAPALQAVNYLASPLQVALFAPLARLGGHLLSQAPKVAGAERGVGFQAAAWRAVASAALASAHALTAWLLVCAPLGVLFYVLLRPAFRRAMRTS